MNRFKKVSAVALAIGLGFLGINQIHAECVKTSPEEGGVKCFNLIAGQNIVAGTVCVDVFDGNLYVTYVTTGGWELVETHAYVGLVGTIPVNGAGNPAPGQFPNKSGPLPDGTTFFEFVTPLEDLNFECPSDDVIYALAAHAALQKVVDGTVVQTETGWSTGPRIKLKGNWATYSTFTLTCDCGGGGSGDPDPTCETAYAMGGACFSEYGFSRWGWTIGALGEGNYNYPIYAGAGQCDPGKGVLVGRLYVTYSGGIVTVEFAMNANVALKTTHVYVGSAPLPNGPNGSPTVSPGHYGSIMGEGITTHTFGASNPVTGSIYVIAHADVCFPPVSP
jgi:hypothetical protein